MAQRLIALVLVLFVGGLLFYPRFSPKQTSTSPKKDQQQGNSSAFTVLSENLNIPWELAFLSNDEILIAERPGNIKLRKKDGQTEEIAKIEVAAVGEGGLLGLALHPDFSKNRYVYVYYTYRDGKELSNKVVRYEYTTLKLAVACPEGTGNCGAETPRFSENKVILEKIPGNSNHNGGRMKFGPDKKLYITTGDAQETALSQDKNSLAGKILRLNDDGSIPEDNPFGNAVYSYGHRNPQGLAWDSNGNLWETEHGSSAYDEVNIIKKGGNYGWPTHRGNSSATGFEKPYRHSEKDTWAPSGAMLVGDILYFSGLRGRSIYKLNTQTNSLTQHLNNEFGRVRVIAQGPNGNFFILTNNRDGRGIPAPSDDRLIEFSSTYLDNN